MARSRRVECARTLNPPWDASTERTPWTHRPTSAPTSGPPSAAAACGAPPPTRPSRRLRAERGSPTSRAGPRSHARANPPRSSACSSSGKARVFYLGADGRQITFETVEAGQPLAAVAAMAGARYPANIDAATPATYACVPTEALFDLLDARAAGGTHARGRPRQPRRELHRGRHDAGARCPEPCRPLRLPARAAVGKPHGHGAARQPRA